MEIQNHLLERQLPRLGGLCSIVSFDINEVFLSYIEISSSVPESVGSGDRSLVTMFQPHHLGFLTVAKHVILVLALIFLLIIWKNCLGEVREGNAGVVCRWRVVLEVSGTQVACTVRLRWLCLQEWVKNFVCICITAVTSWNVSVCAKINRSLHFEWSFHSFSPPESETCFQLPSLCFFSCLSAPVRCPLVSESDSSLTCTGSSYVFRILNFFLYLS